MATVSYIAGTWSGSFIRVMNLTRLLVASMSGLLPCEVRIEITPYARAVSFHGQLGMIRRLENELDYDTQLVGGAKGVGIGAAQ